MYIRAVGPQVKIMDAGIGAAPARALAEKIHASGIRVTWLERADKAAAASKVYFRRNARPIGERIVAMLPAPAPLEEWTTEGCADIIVVLGP